GGVGDVGPAVVGLAPVDPLSPPGVGDDAREEVERPRHLLRVGGVVAAQHKFVQVDNRLADGGVGLVGGAGQDVRLDAGEQAALGGLAGEVAQGVPSGHVVGQGA